MIPYCLYIYFWLAYLPSNMVLNFIYEADRVCTSHSFRNHLLCFNYVLGRVLGAGHSAVNQIFLEGTVLEYGYIKSIINMSIV